MAPCPICGKNIDINGPCATYIGKNYHLDCFSSFTKCPGCNCKMFIPKKQGNIIGDVCLKCNYSYKKIQCDRCGKEHHSGKLTSGIFKCESCIQNAIDRGDICKICQNDVVMHRFDYGKQAYHCLNCGHKSKTFFYLEDNSM